MPKTHSDDGDWLLIFRGEIESTHDTEAAALAAQQDYLYARRLRGGSHGETIVAQVIRREAVDPLVPMAADV